MHANSFLALAAALATASASAIQGFNYGSTNADGSFRSQQDFQSQFSGAQQLAGTNGAFTAARLYTMIQGGSTSDPTSAIPAAIATKTRLLLGMWASSGSTTVTNEINALTAAIKQYGSSFTSLVDGISMGSEDLYRTTPTSFMNDPNSVGASPEDVVNYINQLRSALKGTGLSGAKIGHVDTWTAWVNSSNSAVVDACDWIGMDAYPYYQTTMANSISNGKALFDSAWQQTQAAAKGKDVWITETAWPLSGKTSNEATASTSNAQQYWEAVGCGQLFGKVNTYWYTYYDGSPSPSFGLVSSVGGKPNFDLSCSQKATLTGGMASTIGGGVYETASAASGSGSSYPTASSSAGSAGSTGSSGSGSSGSGSGSSNGTLPGSSGSGAGTPPAPTSSSSGSGSGSGSGSAPATGAAAGNAISFFGLVGAFVAALAL